MTDKFRNANCCACIKPMTRSPHVNLCTLQYQAEWEYPVSGNVLTGKSGQAVAVVCDECIEQEKVDILFALETIGDNFIYHSVADLKEVAS